MSNRSSLSKTLSAAVGSVSDGVSQTSEWFHTERFRSCTFMLSFDTVVDTPTAKIYLETSLTETDAGARVVSMTEKAILETPVESSQFVGTIEPCQKYSRIRVELKSGTSTSFNVATATAEAKT